MLTNPTGISEILSSPSGWDCLTNVLRILTRGGAGVISGLSIFQDLKETELCVLSVYFDSIEITNI